MPNHPNELASLVLAGMTRAELERRIEDEPELWARYRQYVDKMPRTPYRADLIRERRNK